MRTVKSSKETGTVMLPLQQVRMGRNCQMDCEPKTCFWR